jgi:hypothetical protein
MPSWRAQGRLYNILSDTYLIALDIPVAYANLVLNLPKTKSVTKEQWRPKSHCDEQNCAV